jgi:hypothetical protein
VGADKEQLQAIVSELVGIGAVSLCSNARSIADSAHALVARGISQTVAGGRHKPGVGVGWHAAVWPGTQRSDESLGERILRCRDVSAAKSTTRFRSILAHSPVQK